MQHRAALAPHSSWPAFWPDACRAPLRKAKTGRKRTSVIGLRIRIVEFPHLDGAFIEIIEQARVDAHLAEIFAEGLPVGPAGNRRPAMRDVDRASSYSPQPIRACVAALSAPCRSDSFPECSWRCFIAIWKWPQSGRFLPGRFGRNISIADIGSDRIWRVHDLEYH